MKRVCIAALVLILLHTRLAQCSNVEEVVNYIPIESNCHDIRNYPNPCAYALEHCGNASAINYLALTYCYLGHSTVLSLLVFVPLIAYLFLFLATAASKFFCPNLAHIASVLGLSQTVSGVTLVALGNGAADLFGTFSAFSASSSALALGELVGAGLFVTTVVVGAVAVVNPFALPRRPFLRDVCFFLGTVVILICISQDGGISLMDGVILILYYLLYVTVVVVGNTIYRHRPSNKLPHKPTSDGVTVSSLLEDVENTGAAVCSGSVPPGAETPDSDSLSVSSSAPLPSSDRSSVSSQVTFLVIARLVVVKLFKNLPVSEDSTKVWKARSNLEKLLCLLKAPIWFVLKLTVLVMGDAPPESAESLCKRGSPRAMLECIERLYCEYHAEVVLISCEVVFATLFLYSMLFDLGAVFRLPVFGVDVYTLWIATVASISVACLFYFGMSVYLWNSYARRFFRATPPLIWESPNAFSGAKILQSKYLYFSDVSVGSTTTLHTLDSPEFCQDALVEIGHSDTEEDNTGHGNEGSYQLLLSPVLYSELTSFYRSVSSLDGEELSLLLLQRAKVSLALAIFGFVTGIAWIQAISQEMVAILQAIIAITDIDEQLMGMTVFALGNSLPDLVTNLTMARLGFPATAVGSSFGSPMLNILLGVGVTVTFLTFRDAGKEGIPWNDYSYPVEFSKHMEAACGGLMLTLLFSLTVVPLNKFRLSKAVGITLLALYSAVIVFILVDSLFIPLI